MLYCKNCQASIKQGNLFCSKSCAASFNNKHRKRTSESKAKTSTTLKNLIESGQLKKPEPPKSKKKLPHTKLYGLYNCHHCGKEFWKRRHDQKCCSTECRDHICSQNKCKKIKIPYFSKMDNKIVFLQSSWEYTIAEWLDKLNISWTRPEKRIHWHDQILNKNRTYLPDFFLPDYLYYLDVKNPFKQKEDHYKLSQIKLIIPLEVGDCEYIKQIVERLAGIEPA